MTITRIKDNTKPSLPLNSANTATQNTNIILAAITAGKKDILLPPGEFLINNIVLTQDGITFRGAGMPFPNSGRTALVGGTILKSGAIYLDFHKNINITDLGFDSTVTGTYAVYSGDSGTGEQNVLLQNVSALGRGFATSHAFYFTAGDNVIIDNCRAYKFDHAIAIRASDAQITNFYAEDCLSSSIVLKGVHDYDSFNINISNIEIFGNSINTAPIVIEGHDARKSGQHTLNNITMKNVTRGLLFKTADNNTGDGYGSVDNVVVNNVIVENAQYEALLIQYRNVSGINISNMNGINLGLAYGGQAAFSNLTDSKTIRLNNCWTTSTLKTLGYFQKAEVNGSDNVERIVLKDTQDSLSATIFAVKNGLSDVYRQADSFITPISAGSVANTLSEPGPGTRVIYDTGNKLSIASGNLLWTSGVATYDPAIIFNKEILRIPGKIIRFNVTLTTGRIGLSLSTTNVASLISTNRKHVIDFNPGNIKTAADGTANVPGTVSTAPAGTGTFHIILRRIGAYYLFKGLAGTFTYNELVKIDESQLNEILYAAIYSVGTVVSTTIADVVTLDTLWSPSPLVSDGFTVAGTSDGYGHLEGIEGTAGSGGSGVTWTNETGTIGRVSGRVKATALVGGIAIDTVNVSTNRVTIRCRLYGTGAEFGIILRYTDINNYLYLYHDGTNLLLKQVLAGVVSTLRTQAATYVQGAFIEASFTSVTACNLYYNEDYQGFTTSINAGLTSTKFGIFFKNTTNEIDDFQIYARGNNNEYSAIEGL